MTKDLINRITYYLSSGGLFNPELADHLEVRNLLMECREALAQPEQEQLMSDQINYGMSVTQGGKRIDPMSIYKEPEQEPVAWIDFQKEAQQIVESKVLWKRFIDGTPLANDIACWMADFAQYHTTPPQRKPLTDEEINEFFQGMEPNNGFWLSFARAIEQAHGIKELV